MYFRSQILEKRPEICGGKWSSVKSQMKPKADCKWYTVKPYKISIVPSAVTCSNITVSKTIIQKSSKVKTVLEQWIQQYPEYAYILENKIQEGILPTICYQWHEDGSEVYQAFTIDLWEFWKFLKARERYKVSTWHSALILFYKGKFLECKKGLNANMPQIYLELWLLCILK